MGRRAVFLDRDGTLNRLIVDPRTGLADSPMGPEQIELLPGAAEAVRELNGMGVVVVIASNQPAMAKGKTTLQAIDATTDRLRRDLARGGARVDAVYYCLHHPDAVVAAYRARCACRKPAPGLLLRAATDLDIDLSRSFMVGDGEVDVAAAQAAGCVPILLGTARGDRSLSCADLPAAVALIRSAIAGETITR